MDKRIKQITKNPVTNINDVRYFFSYCIVTLELGRNFNPNYLTSHYLGEAELPIFSRREQMALDFVLRECSQVCFKEGTDVMDVWQEVNPNRWEDFKSKITTGSSGLSAGISADTITLTKDSPQITNISTVPKPRITSDDELMINVYRIVLDKKDNKETDIPNPDDLIAKFINQRYERALRPLELALCNDLKMLCPEIFKAVEDAHPSDSPIIGNAL